MQRSKKQVPLLKPLPETEQQLHQFPTAEGHQTNKKSKCSLTIVNITQRTLVCCTTVLNLIKHLEIFAWPDFTGVYRATATTRCRGVAIGTAYKVIFMGCWFNWAPLPSDLRQASSSPSYQHHSINLFAIFQETT